jgi:hypothetical protein
VSALTLTILAKLPDHTGNLDLWCGERSRARRSLAVVAPVVVSRSRNDDRGRADRRSGALSHVKVIHLSRKDPIRVHGGMERQLEQEVVFSIQGYQRVLIFTLPHQHLIDRRSGFPEP